MKKRKRHYLYKRRRAQYGGEAHNIRREGGRVATKETGLLRSFAGDRKTIVRLEFTTGSSFPQGPLGIDLVGSAPLERVGGGAETSTASCEKAASDSSTEPLSS